jgi:hypothetical protein
MRNHVLKPLPLCEFEVSKSWFTYASNFYKKARGKAYIWFIEGPKKPIIFDTGGTAEIIEST